MEPHIKNITKIVDDLTLYLETTTFNEESDTTLSQVRAE